MDTKEESYLVGLPNLFSNICIKKLCEQMDKVVCKIEVGKERGTGFFVKIPFPNIENMLPVLIINNHIINNDLINNEEKKIKIRIEKSLLKKTSI